MNLSRVFAMVGIAFGAVFVIVNSGGLPSAWAIPALAVGTILGAAGIWFGVVRARPAPDLPRRGMRVYWLAVAAEAIAIPVGAWVLRTAFDAAELTVLWVVFAVGAHFLPALAFGLGRYGELGIWLIVLALVFGALRVVASMPSAPAMGGVLAGLSLLAVSAIPSLSRERSPVASAPEP